MMEVNLAKFSNDFYRYGAKDKKLFAWHSVSKFFEEAEGKNPCTARMYLHYAKNSVFDEGICDYNRGIISESKYKKIIYNKLIKEMYPKTYKKRLSILPHLSDSSIVGRSGCADYKEEKTKEYIKRKLKFWT